MTINLTYHILTSLITSIAVCPIVIWLFKTWITVRLKEAIKNEYALKLEAFKNELKQQSELNLERLKYQINVLSIEHQVKFTNLHETRVKFIAELYAMIQTLGFTAYSVIKCIEGRPTLHKPERLINLKSITEEFKLFYNQHKIYFKKAICKKIDTLCKECESILNGLKPTEVQEVDLDKINEINTSLNKICGKIQITIPGITDDLEEHFKILLGVEKEDLPQVSE